MNELLNVCINCFELSLSIPYFVRFFNDQIPSNKNAFEVFHFWQDFNVWLQS